MNLGLKGKRALVLAGSNGIGKAVAKALADEGARVAICARTKKTLESAAKETGAETFFECDLSRPGAGGEAVQKTIEALGGVEILVTNTGGPAKGKFAEITDEQWSNDFQSLWLSVVDSVNAALPAMTKAGFGRVVMITSIAAKKPLAGLTTSNGLRAGLEGLARSIAMEVSPHGVTLNLILPGYTNTDRLKALNLSPEKVREMVPVGRLAEPGEIGDLAAFLASDLAGSITGQSILVDGGAAI